MPPKLSTIITKVETKRSPNGEWAQPLTWPGLHVTKKMASNMPVNKKTKNLQVLHNIKFQITSLNQHVVTEAAIQ